MQNRKFDIKKDFSELNELENVIMPIIRKIDNPEDKMLLSVYIRKIFNNQYKK